MPICRSHRGRKGEGKAFASATQAALGAGRKTRHNGNHHRVATGGRPAQSQNLGTHIPGSSSAAGRSNALARDLCIHSERGGRGTSPEPNHTLPANLA